MDSVLMSNLSPINYVLMVLYDFIHCLSLVFYIDHMIKCPSCATFSPFYNPGQAAALICNRFNMLVYSCLLKLSNYRMIALYK